MKKIFFAALAGMLFLILPALRLHAQTDAQIQKKVEKCAQDYMQLSALGSAGSVYIDETTVAAFRDLFELDANCFWDLPKTDKQRLPYLLTVEEYISKIRNDYKELKPVVTYLRPTVEVFPGGKSAIAFIRKTNHISASGDSVKHKAVDRGVNLQILYRITKDTIRIQNITEDTRLTRVRSIGLEVCLNLVSSLSGAFFAAPVSAVSPETSTGYTVESHMGFTAGANVDIRLSRKELNGWVVNVACVYSHANLSTTVNNYMSSYNATFNQCNPFSYTANDRSPVVQEEIALDGISLPVTIKRYFNRSLYVKAGPEFSFMTGTSSAAYALSHTGSGRFQVIADPTQWFTAGGTSGEPEVTASQYGFYTDQQTSANPTVKTSSLCFSVVVAAGFETRIKKMVLNIEPWLALGLNSTLVDSGSKSYVLNPSTEANSFVQTFKSPRLNTIGIKVILGKMFYR